MKRLLIVFFLSFLGSNHFVQAQEPEDFFNELSKLVSASGDGILDNFFSELKGVKISSTHTIEISSYTKCLYVMLIYADEYDRHLKRIERADDCQEKYDLYGVLLMIIGGSTTIAYCPENLLDLLNNPNKNEEKEKFYAELEFIASLMQVNYPYSNDLTIEDELFMNLVLTINKAFNNHYDDIGIKILIHKYFDAQEIINTTITIGEVMDAMPCSPGAQRRKSASKN